MLLWTEWTSPGRFSFSWCQQQYYRDLVVNMMIDIVWTGAVYDRAAAAPVRRQQARLVDAGRVRLEDAVAEAQLVERALQGRHRDLPSEQLHLPLPREVVVAHDLAQLPVEGVRRPQGHDGPVYEDAQLVARQPPRARKVLPFLRRAPVLFHRVSATCAAPGR